MKLPFGKRDVSTAKSFARSGVCFGLAGGLAVCYFTDWQFILRYMPIYNTKYPPKDSKK